MSAKRLLTGLAVAVAMSVLVSGIALSLDPEFIDYDSNPVLDPATRAYYPEVLYSATGFDGNGASSPYKMWYDAGPDIWLAYSDDGITWSVQGAAPVLAGLRHPHVQYRSDSFGDAAGDLIQASFPETYAVTPYYKMWLWNEAAIPDTVDFAYSDDGVTWHTNYAQDVLPNTKLWGSSVVYDLEVLYHGGTYYGYADNNGHLYATTSSDGTTWSVGTETFLPSPGEWDSVNYSRASVVRISGSEWHMWFGGTSKVSGGGNWGIGHATSSDGLNWTKDSPNVPLQELGGYGPFGGLGDTDTWNEDRNYTPCVIYDTDRFDGNGEASLFKMWRTGRSVAGTYTVGYTGTEVYVEPPEPGPTTFHPIAGDDRYETAVEASEEAFPGGSQTVIIATGRNWPDALGGSALAGAEMCPILLVDTNSIPDVVAAEITRLGATKAIILGGSAAVSGSVSSQLGGMGLSVTRLGGSDRYATAELIADAAVARLGGAYDGTAFAATGADFPDALAASPLAYAQGWPIYLVAPNEGAPIAKMVANGVTDVVILGGPAAVTGTAGAAVSTSFASGTVIRLQGDDRYETAVEVATYGVDDAGMDWDWLAIATGENFPDALAGGVVPARRGSVMMLTKTATLPDVVGQSLLANQDDIAHVYYLGGTAAVSAAVRAEVAAQLH